MRTRTTIALILVVLVAASAVIYSRVGRRPHADMNLVARALSSDAGRDYIAQVVTTTKYNGKAIEAQATVYHRGGMHKVEYSGASGQSTWSMTRDGKSYTYLPRSNSLLVSETSKMLSDADRSALLAANYTAVSEGTDEVAGRNAYVVDIVSRHDGRPSKRLWIDRQYLTILRSIDYSAAGDERGRMEIRRIRYGSRIRPSMFAIPTGKAVRVVMVCKSAPSMDLFRTLGMPVHTPRYVPAGYRLEGYHLFNSQCNCDHRSAQLTYTDGLNVVSVFQTPKMACCKDGVCNMANCGKSKGCAVANSDVAKTGLLQRKDRTVVVVGDLLPDDVRKIAESVR